MPDLLDDLRRYGAAVEATALEHTGPMYGADDEPSRPPRRGPSRRAVIMGIVATVALIAVIASIALVAGDDRNTVRAATPPTTSPVTAPPSTAPPSTTPPGTTTELPPSSASWAPIDPGPLSPRFGQATVWTGREMIIWGGEWSPQMTGPRGSVLGDGAAFDPEAGSWRTLPAAPLAARMPHVGVWTGSEMIVWGGASSGLVEAAYSDGAAYDPALDTWRTIAASPLPTDTVYSGAWTGSEMIVAGIAEDGLHAGSYDPRTDSWHVIDTGGADLQAPLNTRVRVQTLWTGSRLVVVPDSTTGVALPTSVLDPVAATWSTSAAPEAEIFYLDATVLRGQVHVISGSAEITTDVRFDAVGGGWSLGGLLTGLGCQGGAPVVALPTTILVQACDRAGFFDPEAQTMQPVAAIAGSDGSTFAVADSVVWTGEQILAWGRVASGSGLGGSDGTAHTEGWSLTP